eukprot:7376085-Prymnesium_polylepis.1
MWCGVVRRGGGVVRCGVVWCRCGAVWCRCGAVWCRCGAVWCGVVPVWCGVVRCGAGVVRCGAARLNGVVEEHDVLRHDAQLSAQRLELHAAHVLPAATHATRGRWGGRP